MNIQEAILKLQELGEGYMIRRPFWTRGLISAPDETYGHILTWHDAPENTPVYPILKLTDQVADDYEVIEIPKEDDTEDEPKTFYGRLMYCYAEATPDQLYPRIVVGRGEEDGYIAINRNDHGQYVYEIWEAATPLDFKLIEIPEDELFNPSVEDE